MSALHKALTRCTTYPDKTSRIEHRETHISHLYLTDNLVYKIKKKIDFGFCNFTSLDRRRFYCEEEVRLNRRLAPDCYLGVSKIVRRGDEFLIDQPGKAYEYAVRMRRLPQELMLVNQLCDPEQAEGLILQIKNIGRLIAKFHTEAVPIDTATHNDLRSIQFFWQQNFDQTRSCPDSIIRPASRKKLEQIVIDYMHENSQLLVQRQELGYVRDGHGDLHCEHICLSEPIQIFDCIEFNPDLRYGDILNDLAFLYMDLELRQRSDLAASLWQSYRQEIETGPAAKSLLRFYCLYRAWVRAKVHYFQINELETGSEHRQQARAYFHLANSYALPQTLLLCCGLIGSGKSTLARDLGSALRVPVISSDLSRPKAAKTSSHSAYGQGRYSPESRLDVYRRLAEQAASALAEGSSLIVDATFETQQMRELFLDIAKRMAIPCFFIATSCPPALIRARLRDRAAHPRQAAGSEARLEDFERQRLRFEPLSAEHRRIAVDTGQPREYNVDFLLEKLLQACGTLQ